jgi:hypothetical protein
MAMFLTISEGDGGPETRPILATSDQRIIRDVISAIERRVASKPLAPIRPIRGRKNGGDESA